MVRWPWKDVSRGPEEWSKIPEEEQKIHREDTTTFELGRYPEDYEDFKADFDHAQSPYDLVGEENPPDDGCRVFTYELDESLRDQLECPRLAHTFIFKVPIDWLDPGKLEKLIEDKESNAPKIVKVPRRTDCPTCGQKLK